MPTDGLTLGFLARECDAALKGGRVDRIFQPDRYTIILSVRSLSDNYKLLVSADTNMPRVQLTDQAVSNPQEPPMFCMLLRKRLQGAKLASIRQIKGDRVIWIDFETLNDFGDSGTHRLIAECTGRNSNIVLTDESNKIVDAIRHVNASMSRFREVLPGKEYVPPPDQEKLDPTNASAEAILARLPETGKLSRAISDAVAGFGPASAREFAGRISGDSDASIDQPDRARIAERLAALLASLDGMKSPAIVFSESGIPVDAYAFAQATISSELQRSAPSLSEAMDMCFAGRDARERMSRRSTTLRRALDSAIERAEKKRAIQMEALARSAEIEKARRAGDLLTANLYRIPKGTSSVTLEDFYEPDAPAAAIALDQTLSPSANAQRYYKQARKLRTAMDAAAEQKRATDESLLFLNAQRLDLENCTDETELAEVREQLIKAGIVRKDASKRKPKKIPASKPYRFISANGIEIVVGKTSAQNDRVTASARGEETWLHAKDMPGSHVIIRKEGDIPAATLENALTLAAWFSKGRGSSNVPVDVTLRKHVKKPGGAPLGFVTYTHQRTYAVTPEEAAVRGIKQLV